MVLIQNHRRKNRKTVEALINKGASDLGGNQDTVLTQSRQANQSVLMLRLPGVGTVAPTSGEEGS